MTDTNKSLNITVLMGGPSSEREISLLSGQAISQGLTQAGHNVKQADISPDDISALDDPADLFFIALHGDFGESGQVQQLCQERNLIYTGSGPKASQLGMDKIASKEVFRNAGLNTPDWIVLDQTQSENTYHKLIENFPLPCVVKPISAGSSVDVFICDEFEMLHQHAIQLLDKYDRVMVEQFVAGREVTVGILGNQALPLIEIRPDSEFYDHFAKYSDQAKTSYVFDHGISKDIVERCQQEALVAFQKLGCRDLSRVDFIIDENDVPQVLEINTIPGFTSHSLLPQAAKKNGIEFTDLVDQIAKLALQRKVD